MAEPKSKSVLKAEGGDMSSPNFILAADHSRQFQDHNDPMAAYFSIETSPDSVSKLRHFDVVTFPTVCRAKKGDFVKLESGQIAVITSVVGHLALDLVRSIYRVIAETCQA